MVRPIAFAVLRLIANSNCRGLLDRNFAGLCAGDDLADVDRRGRERIFLNRDRDFENKVHGDRDSDGPRELSLG